MKTKLVSLLTLSLIAILALPATFSAQAAEGPQVDSEVFLPFITMSSCPGTSTNSYAQGMAFQWDTDDPVRPAAAHADKNIELRGYNLNMTEAKSYQNKGSDDPTMPPQFRTMFEPDRVPPFTNVYRINNWNWGTSPDPGTRGDEVTMPPVTVLGLQTTPGEVLQVPASGYSIGGSPTSYEALVIFADEDSVALKYTREDSVAPNGYLVHVDNICTDPNLLALYNTLDNPSGARYVFCGGLGNCSYDLPNLTEGQVFGTARDTEIRVAVVDSGTTQDPRSCYEFWEWQHPAPGGGCP